jgi:hypothetical protein
VHAKTNHVFIIVDGEATFVTGGTLVNAKETAPDQIRASSIQGGQTHHLTRGRCDHNSRKDAALVQGNSDPDDCLLRGEHRKLGTC